MVRTRVVTGQQADEAFAEDLSLPAHLFGPTTVKLIPGFTDYVSQELADRLGPGAAQAGLRVTTSVDLGLQQLAQQSIANTVKANAEREVTDGALVAMGPKPGQITGLPRQLAERPGCRGRARDGIQKVVDEDRRMGAPPYKNPGANHYTVDDLPRASGPR